MLLRRLRFQNFHIVYRADRWFRDRLTGTGATTVGLFGLATLFAVNTRASLSYQLSVLAGSLLVVALLAAPAFRGRFTVRRVLPAYAAVDTELTYRVSIGSAGRRVVRGLVLRERLDPGPPDLDEFFRTRALADRKRNWFDRKVGYPRWASFMRLHRGARVEEAAVPDIAPGARVEVDVRLTPARRGILRLGGSDLVRPDPLGLFNARVRIGGADTIVVLPRSYPVSWRTLLGQARDRVGGQSESPQTGGSGEFAALREYRPGDPMRHIHWRGWARHGEPIVKEFHEESFARQAIFLDTCRPPAASGERFEEAVSVAASFARASASDRVAVDQLFLGARAVDISSGPRPAACERILAELACASPADDEPLASARETLASHRDEFGGIVCVLLAWDAERLALVRGLRDEGAAVLVLVTEDVDVDGSEPALPVPEGLVGLHRVPVGQAAPVLAGLR